MRERLAEILAALTALLVIALAAAFSLVQNAPRAPAAPPPAEAGALAAGRAVFERHGCGGCHSAGGEGNPRFPLDGVAARRSRAELHDWTVAAEAVRPQMSTAAARLKQRYASLPPEDLQALIDYLASLR